MRAQFVTRQFGIVLTAMAVAFSAFPVVAAERIPNDPYFRDLWYLRHIGVTEAWNKSLGLETVPIAIIDSGVDINHPDLKDNIWFNADETPGNGIDDDRNGYVDDVHGWDFVGSDNDPRPDVSGNFNQLGVNHGTINAGVAAARGDNGIGTVGVTWQATIMPLRALDSSGGGDPTNVIRAVEYAVANGAKVINLSFAGPANNELLAIALRRAYDQGVFVVAAAGNAPEGGSAQDLDVNPLYPICLDRDSSENFVYGVAATDDKDLKAAFSNYGAGCVDLSAPGTRFLAPQYYDARQSGFTEPYGGYYNGTSLAAPVVSGVVALIRALDRNLTPKQIMNLLTESAFNIDALNPGYYGKLGRGRIEAARAVALATAGRKEEAPLQTTASLLPPSAGRRLIVTAPGPGRAPEIRLFTADGLFIRGFNAFPEAFRGGVNLAVGNFDGNGKQSVIAGAGPGGAPQIRIFNANTKPIGGFLAYDANFRGGVSVAAADLDGDGRDEIVTGAGPGGGPHIRLFRADGTPVGGFFAFDQKFRGGVSVAAADVNFDGMAEIVVATGPGGATTVRIFDRRGRQLTEFQPFGGRHRDGAVIALGEVNLDGQTEIIVTAAGRVRQFAAFSAAGIKLETPALRVASVNYRAAGASGQVLPSPIFLRGLSGDGPTVAAFGVVGRLVTEFQAYESKFRGGVSVGAIDF